MQQYPAGGSGYTGPGNNQGWSAMYGPGQANGGKQPGQSGGGARYSTPQTHGAHGAFGLQQQYGPSSPPYSASQGSGAGPFSSSGSPFSSRANPYPSNVAPFSPTANPLDFSARFSPTTGSPYPSERGSLSVGNSTYPYSSGAIGSSNPGPGNHDTVRVYHYTTQAGYKGILNDGVIKASTPILGDANGGQGVYFSTVDPLQSDTKILEDCWQNQTQQHPELYQRTQYALAFDLPRHMLGRARNAEGRNILMFQGDFQLGETTQPKIVRRF